MGKSDGIRAAYGTGRRAFSAVFLSATVLVLTVLMSGCGYGPVESFELEVYKPKGQGTSGFETGPALSIRELPDVRAEEEGELLAGEGVYAGPEYKILYPKSGPSRQAAGPEDGDTAAAGPEGDSGGDAPEQSKTDAGWADAAFHILYSSELPLVLEVRTGVEKKREDLKQKQYELPETSGETVRIILPLENDPLRYFRFRSEGKEDPSFRMISLALQTGTKDGSGFVYLPDTGLWEKENPRFRQYSYSLEYSYKKDVIPASFGENGGHAEADALPVVELNVNGEGDERHFRLSSREGRHRVYFYSKDLGFQPEEIVIGALPPGFRVEQITLRPFTLYARSSPEPIPADPGVILRYSPQAWRRSDWELFSWNLFSNILIFDFRDYAVQSAFLKRLSFFVEKKGSAGKLLPNEVLAPLHGWNAHDYRAEDLARFFQRAEEEEFPLNQEEYQLRDILLDQGILYRENGKYFSNGGGILSLSRESSERLRYLFMTHEGYHGLYFASPEYRRKVEEYWSGLSGEEQEFWKIFLDWKWYNTRDTDLVMNEFQAYLMQQHISYVDTYFKEYTIPRFLRYFPEFEEKASVFLERYPDHFTRSAAFLEESARSIAGISAGDILCLREGPRKE
jgi:hypothetical protein